MKLSKVAVCVLAALSAAPSFAADLVEVYNAAHLQDATFAAAQAAQLAGKEKLTQGRAGLLPTLNLSANSTYNDNQYVNNAAYTGSYNSSGYSLVLSQPLFRQQNWQLYTESDLQVVMSDAQFKLAQQDLILRASQAYFDVLMAQDAVRLAAAQKQAIAEQLAQAKRNFEVGTATITDTYEAQARFDLVLSQEIVASSNLEIKQRALQQITNAEFSTLNPLGKAFDLDAPQPADIQQWVTQAQQSSAQVELAQAGSEIADKEVSRAFGGHLPTLDLVASYGNTKGKQFGNSYEVTNQAVGVQLNMPIFQGGASQSKWREADANREKAKQDLESAKRSVALSARQSYLGVENGIAQVKALQQALKSSASLLEASKLGQAVGVRTNLDVLNAQQQFYSTERDLLQAEYGYLMSRLRLKAAAGTLSADDVAGVNLALH